jgi:DNA-directed RNA polymerase subunit D
MIKLIAKEDNKITFETDMPIALANAVRRSVNYIPILAIDTVEITKNDSALYDEIISHRLGLIPLVNEDLKLSSECDCGKEDGCGKCSVKLKLSMKGPCTVYSTDLSPKDSVIYKMPITLLNEEQGLEFVAIAKMGLGKDHAKHIPGLFFYKYSEDVQGKEDDESFNKIIESAKKDENKPLTVSIEAWGQIPVKKIFPEAVDALNKELKALIKEVK